MPDYATETEHARAVGNPATRYVAVNRAVMLGQVFICRAPSHEKAKKLAKILSAFPVLVEALRATRRQLGKPSQEHAPYCAAEESDSGCACGLSETVATLDSALRKAEAV